MEADYQSAMSSLFPSHTYSQTGFFGNPFQDELSGQNGSGDNDNGNDNGDGGNNGNDNGNGGNNGNGGDNGNGGNNGNNGNGGGDNGSGGDSPPPPPAGSTEGGFLVLTSPPAGNPLQILHRAARDPDGYFLLEDGGRIDVLSGLVGFPQDMLVLPQGGVLMSKASADSETLKVVSIQDLPLGTSVVGSLDVRGQQQFWFSAVMLYERALSAVLYDINDDGEEELVCALNSSPNLIVYRIDETGITYLRELTLPFKPTALVTTGRSAPIDARYLQVFNSNLSRSVTFSSQFSGAYSFSVPPTYRGKTSLDTAPGILPSASFVSLVYDDRVVLFQLDGADATLRASLSTSSGFPRLIVGNYAGDETRQMVFLP